MLQSVTPQPHTAAPPASPGRLTIGQRVRAAGRDYVVRRYDGVAGGLQRYAVEEVSDGRSATLFALDAGSETPALRGALKAGWGRVTTLDHDRLVSVHGVLDGDVAGVVCASAEGPLLSDYIAEYGALPADVAMTLFRELAIAVHVMHDAGLHHGALCPEAVRVGLEADRIVPRLELLFAAPLVGRLDTLDAALAPYRPARPAETPRFDDIYAIGGMLMYALTGAEPGTPGAGRALGQRDDLPDEMTSMLGQCLQADASKRFQSLVAVANVLQHLLSELESDVGSPERPKPGQVVADQYVVERMLGEGGMARVYLARDNVMGTLVALKLLNASCLSEPQVVERFLEEASIQARLVHPEPHPNIVAVHRVLHEAPVGYVMEYVEGTTLDEVLAEQQLSERELVEIFEQIARGLHHAHVNRIVHRDLKPSNILLSRDHDGGWIAKLMDFGISKQLDQPKTRTNIVLGTLGYIAPELFISAKDASPSSDLYALGCCIFEALVGDVPFAVTGGLRSLAFRVYNEPAPTPSERGASISPEFETLIMIMLEKRADARPESAKWVADRLRSVSAGASDEALANAVHARSAGVATTARPGTVTTGVGTARATTTRTAPSSGSRRALLAAIAIMLIAVVAIVAYLLAVNLSASDEPDTTAEEGSDTTTPPETTSPPEPPPATATAPTEPEAGRNVLPASRVMGAADLLAQARAAAAGGDKREALELYEKAAARFEEDPPPDVDEVEETLVEMATLYEAVAEEVATEGDGDGEDGTAAEAQAERAELLASASVAYGRAAELSREYSLYMKKAELDQERGDASSALDALREAADLAVDDDTKDEAEQQIARLERAYEEGSEDDEEEEARVPVGPLPANMIEVWIESKPERAQVYLGRRRLGRTPLIKRVPKQPGALEFTLKSRGRYDETVKIDGQKGGKFAIRMSFKPRKIK